MPASPIYSPINDSEIESGDPITVSLGLRWAKNYLSVIQGAPSARDAGLGVWIEKSPGGGDPAQTAILTDATDTSLRLAPDGAGSVAWSAVVNCSGNLLQDGTLYQGSNTSVSSESSSEIVFGGKKITQETANTRMQILFSAAVFLYIARGSTVTLKLWRKRSGTNTLLESKTLEILIVTGDIGDPASTYSFCFSFNYVLTDCANGDSFFVTMSAGTYSEFGNGSLTIASIN